MSTGCRPFTSSAQQAMGGLRQRPRDFRTWEDAADKGEPAQKPRWHLRPDLAAPPAGFRILRSGAEQAPWFDGKPYCERAPMKTGDYTLQGFHEPGTPEQPRGIVLERKSLEDLYGSFSAGRERLEREYERMRGFKRKAICIEAGYPDVLDPERQDHGRQLLAGVLEVLSAEHHPEAIRIRRALQELGWWNFDPDWRSRMAPQSVEGSLFAWGHRAGVEVLFGGSRRLAERMAFRWLATWYIEQEGGL